MKDLKPDNSVDLEGNPITCPEHSSTLLANERQIVADLEIATPVCTVVPFNDFSCGFPRDCLVKVRKA